MKTYGELKIAIADWLNREDLAGIIPSFVMLAEDKIYRRLRVRENEFLVHMTENDDPFNPIELPENFREMKLLAVNDTPLQRISDERYYELIRNGGSWDNNQLPDNMYFAVMERDLYILPWPDETKTVEEWGDTRVDIHYYGTESLSEMATWNTPTNPNQVPESTGTPPETSMRGDDATTRLLQVASDVYLYASLAEAYRYLKSPQESAEYSALAKGMINDLQMESANGEYSGSTVAVANTYIDNVRRHRR